MKYEYPCVGVFSRTFSHMLLPLIRAVRALTHGCATHEPFAGPDVPQRRTDVRMPTRMGAVARAGLLAACALTLAAQVHAQVHDDPAGATALALPTVGTGATIPSAATPCPVNALSSSWNIAGTHSAGIPAPSCGTFVQGVTGDVWFLLVIPPTPVADRRYRITLSQGTGPAPLMNGAMAAYSAPSAAGPFNLLDCAFGGNSILGQAFNPAIELPCLAGGTRVYIRVWNEASTTFNSSFDLCIQFQNFGTWLPSTSNVYDTPCLALNLGAPVASCGSTSTGYIRARNTLACDEGFNWDPSCGDYRGGDVWFSIPVPANGALTVSLATSSTTSEAITRMGVTAYTAPNCSSWGQFNEVGCWSGTISSSVTTALILRCLVPGTTVWVRGYATEDAQNFPPRFGGFRICTGVVSAALAPSVANNTPCDATNVPMGTCRNAETNLGACLTPGVPAPRCGIIATGSADVWYRFAAPASGRAQVNVTGVGTFDPGVAVYTTGTAPCTSPLTWVGCDAVHGNGRNAYIVLWGLIPGQTYYVRVWGEGSAGVGFPAGTEVGNFDVCISEVVPPAGMCYYQLDFSSDWYGTGAPEMHVTIGSVTTVYTVAGGEASQTILIPVPSGAMATFTYMSGTGGGTQHYYISQVGSVDTLVIRHPGVAVVGPTPIANYVHTLGPACGPIWASAQDCLGAQTICNAGAVFGNTEEHTGNIVDLTAANRGCLSSESRGGRWFYFRPVINGNVAFAIQDVSPGDFDFAVWDGGAALPPATCPPAGPPIRCSSAPINGYTGLLNGSLETWEGVTGDSWVSPLTVTANHVYILYVTNIHAPNRQFQLAWTTLTTAGGIAAPDMLDCLVLPVELTAFDAKPHVDEVDISWATASEQSSSHFLVERSIDGQHFGVIGQVAAAGFTQGRTDYGFVDQAPLSGLNYYRLCQVDQDGTIGTSQVRVVEMDGVGGEAVVYPNPAMDLLHVLVPTRMDQQLTLQVIDATGRCLRTRTVVADGEHYRTELDIADLAPGYYVLNILGPKGTIGGPVRFAKQ